MRTLDEIAASMERELARRRLERQLRAARERYRVSPSPANTEECERLYLELCQLQAEEENRQRERRP